MRVGVGVPALPLLITCAGVAHDEKTASSYEGGGDVKKKAVLHFSFRSVLPPIP